MNGECAENNSQGRALCIGAASLAMHTPKQELEVGSEACTRHEPGLRLRELVVLLRGLRVDPLLLRCCGMLRPSRSNEPLPRGVNVPYAL